MIVRPMYNLVLLPDVNYYFKNDFLKDWSPVQIEAQERILFLVLRENKPRGELQPEDFYPIGVSAKIDSIESDGSIRVHTLERVDVSDIEIHDGFIQAEACVRGEISDLPPEEAAERFSRTQRTLLQFVQKYQWGMWARSYILQWNNLAEAACTLTEYLSLTPDEKYQILAVDSERERYDRIEHAIYELVEVSKVSEEAQTAQKDDQEQLYREAAIKKQIGYLQQELDEMHPENISDVQMFEKKIAESGMNETARKEAEKVLSRMKQEGQDGHEYGMLYDYLDFLTSLSWKAPEPVSIDLDEAQRILDEDHYSLKKVKERIIQQIAVMSLNKKQSGSILLFTGAPGTGKTSIGQSIARALGRSYARISLGGVRDEAEIRGHRRTYIGAMPGRIMEGIKRSGASNPVVVLDEVDKLSKDYSGDPASALLEVLDPEQNNTFTDHYLNVPYDLSNVLFICTANTTDTIPEPLLNRMEVIPFNGYTEVEKIQIAERHLIPKAEEAMGIPKEQLEIPEDVLRQIITDYTMESGVRGLKKQIDALCRALAVRLVKQPVEKLTVHGEDLHTLLGRKQLHHDMRLTEADPGIVTGLAWTSAGGEILYIESRLMRGDGKVTITGQLGDVMKESVQIALSLVKIYYPEETKILEDHDLHIHIPAGAIPKDGPSAGITLVTALSSLVTGVPVPTEYAMTGEVSLRGCVLPIGGLPEKLMAAQRAGIEKVFIPQDNVEDLEDVAEEVKEKLTILPVKKIRDVLDVLIGK
nr:endopeptidase La [uncultured Sellimonas sp.]